MSALGQKRTFVFGPHQAIRKVECVVELTKYKSRFFILLTGAVQAGVWNLLPGTELGAALVTPGAAPPYFKGPLSATHQ